MNPFTTLAKNIPNTLEHGDQWRDLADCRDEDPERWFPVGDSPAAQQQADDAIAICNGCPVLATCRDWAMDTRQESGVWGGMTEKARHNLRRREARAAGRPVPPDTTLQMKARRAYDENTDPVGEHRVWVGVAQRRIDDVMYSAKQLAWAAVHGERPNAPLLNACGYAACVLPEHQRLGTPRRDTTLQPAA